MEMGSRVYHAESYNWGTVLGENEHGEIITRLDGTAVDTVLARDSVRCPVDEERRYRIVRHYQRGGNRTIARGLTLAEARAHCSDAETSSSTATGSAARARTRRMGAWFDGYTDRG